MKRQSTGPRAVNRFCAVLRGGYMSAHIVQHGEGITPRGALVHSAGSVSGPRVGVGGDGDHGPRGTQEAVRVGAVDTGELNVPLNFERNMKLL